MLITRKTKVPLHWAFYAQLSFSMTIWAGFMTGAPFLLSMKKFIDDPAAITFLLSLDILVTVFNGAFINWLSDRIWTRFGRRKILSGFSDIGKLMIMPLMPLAPDMWTLVALKWAYTIMADFGSPSQALTMEVIPTAQRGRGAGFFQMQLNLANLIFWGVVIGRFDDVYFMGPLAGVLSLSGEHLMFFSSSLLFLAVAGFTFLGFKEIKPPTRRTLADDRQPGELFVWTFLRTFFRDILGRDLLPLYLLLFVGSMANLGLGILGPLLYVEQWGYTTQDMGTNVAIGAFINIFIALLAGYFADATSKMRVYVWALIIGLALKFAWAGYVFFKPGHRPELWEILVFGEVTAIFGMIAGTVSFPLILEFVERNRLGTAGAGMGLFNRILGSALTVFIGAWVVWWSIWFLPQAGDYVELVFKNAKDHQAVAAHVASAGVDPAAVHLEPKHRPGIDAPTSRHWIIRHHTARSAGLQSEKKDVENHIAKWNTSLQTPGLAAAKREELTRQIAEARRRIAEIEADLTGSAREFSGTISQATAADLVVDGGQILAASDDGSRLSLDLDVVEPVTPGLAGMLAAGLESSEFDLVPDPARPGEFHGLLDVEPLAPPANGLRVTAIRDPRFAAINRAIVDAGITFEAAFGKSSFLIEVLRELLGRAPGSFAVSGVAWQNAPARLEFLLHPGPGTELPPARELAGLLSETGDIASAEATPEEGGLRIRLGFDKPLPAGNDAPNSPVATRLASLLGTGGYVRDNMLYAYHRIVETAAAKPVFLTVTRPIVKQTFADRVYDYFFSVYFLMIVTDFFGLGVIALIISLERRGIVHRCGVEEDAKR